MKAPRLSCPTRHAWPVVLAVAAGCTTPSGVSPASDPAADEAPEPDLLPAPAVPAAAAQTPQPAAPETAAKPEKQRGPLSGYLQSRYRLRSAGGDSDQDIYEVLGLDYADPKHPEFAAHFLGRGVFDIDGDSGPLFSSVNDVDNGSVDADVYEGFVDVGTKDGRTRARIGRMSEYLTPEIAYIDGLELRSRIEGKNPLEFGAYGGRNVTFEGDTDTSDDNSVFGAFAEYRAWQGGRVRADWMHLNDAQLLGDDNNDLAGLGIWQSWSSWSASGEYTNLEGRDRDLELRTRWSDEQGKSSVQLRYFELLEEQNQRALFLDPFSQSLQTYYPFRQLGLSGWHALTENTEIDAGIDFREVDDPNDVGTYNHDWNRYFATLTLRELIAKWTVSVTGDYYDDDQSDYQTWGGSLSRPFGSGWDVALGSYYSLYKYDFYTAQERDDVRSYYGRLSWRRSDMWTFELLYEYEDDDLEEYNTLRCGALCRF